MKKITFLSICIFLFLNSIAQCDSTEYLAEGKLITNTDRNPKIKITKFEVLPEAGQTGSLNKYFEKTLFGGIVTGWLEVGLMEVVSVKNNIITFKLITEKSVVTINGKKKNHFEKGNLMQFSWKSYPQIIDYKEYSEDSVLLVEGKTHCGKKTGEWRIFDNEKNLIEKQQYDYDVLHGVNIAWYKNNQTKFIKKWNKGILSGKYKSWFENGKPKIFCKYNNNKLTGKYESFYENGNPKEVKNFKNDIQTDNYKYFYSNGNIKEQGNYKNQQFDGKRTQYFEDGNIKNEFNFIVGIKDGEYKEFHTNSQIKTSGTYINNKLDSTWTEYFESGQVKLSGHYSIGLKKDLWLEFYENGKPKSKGIYGNDKKIGKWFFWDKKGKKNKIKY